LARIRLKKSTILNIFTVIPRFHSRVFNYFALLLLLTGGTGVLSVSASLIAIDHALANYKSVDGPGYSGRHAATDSRQADEIRVVSYNIRYGEQIEEVVSAFASIGSIKDADIILLQEMDEAGTAEIARRLGYNYVYYPASIAPDGDNFGNAVLARWPIADSKKLVLPGLHPLTGQQRTATRATVRIGDEAVLVYSTHIEVATAPPAMRAAQIQAIIDDIPADAPRVIVGGDFNTVTNKGVQALGDRFDTAGMNHDTADLGPTFIRWGRKLAATDHIFSRGFDRHESGVVTEVSASDHLPVWTQQSWGQ
jgi:endonuclease/exonuclease/phosphatase family metal-dependent hydrolase